MLVYKRLPPNSLLGSKRKGQTVTQTLANAEVTSLKKIRNSNGDAEVVEEIQQSSIGNGVSILNGAMHLKISCEETDKREEVSDVFFT